MPDIPEHGPAADWRAVRTGVVLAPEPDDTGEWLAEAAAFDAAGADALWVGPGPEPQRDVLALTAALAAATFRSLLVLALPEPGPPEAGLARTLATIESLSRGRLALVAGPGQRHPAPGVRVFRRRPDDPGLFEGPDGPDGPDEAVSWASAPPPQGRASWRAARVDAAEHGVRGLVVPADPLLLDILRNPDGPGERRDLHLAQG